VPTAVCAWHGLRSRPGQQADVEADAEMDTNPT
jgi:hypothetical protein